MFDFLKEHALGLILTFAALVGGWKLLEILSAAKSPSHLVKISPLPETQRRDVHTSTKDAESKEIAPEPLQFVDIPASVESRDSAKLSETDVITTRPKKKRRAGPVNSGPSHETVRSGVPEGGAGSATELSAAVRLSPTLAIDFGSSRTKVAYFCADSGKPKIIELGQEIRSIIPSVFYIPQKGPVLIGDDAAQMADEDPTGIVTDIKRELHRPSKIRCGEGRPAYLRSELVSHLFREIRRRCGEEVFHTGPSSDCILTVPVCFSEPQRQKLREAAEHAGFTSVRLLEEPIAAAMHWLSSSGKSVSDHVIVVDIGGGTTDLAALKLSGETYEPIPDLPSSGFACGGNDIDEDVRRAMQKDFACNDEDSGGLLLKLRSVKERLVKTDSDVFSVGITGKSQTIQRAVVEAAVRTLVEKTSNEVARFLKDFEEVTGRTDTPVLLAGGGSKLLGMKEALKEVAGSERVFVWNYGEYAIALGAALAGASERNKTSSISS